MPAITVQAPTSAEETKQADLAELKRLMEGAKAESDAFEALRRKGAAAIFRCGSLLAPARDLAKSLKIGWYGLLEQYQIAEATSRQAIELYANATAAGYSAEDL